MTAMKTCRKCGAFFESRDCGACAKERAAKYYSENSEKLKARQAKYRAENLEKVRAGYAKYRAENPEKIRARKERWNAANPDYCKEKSKQYREEHPEMVAAARARWLLANPDAKKTFKHNRRARELAVGGRLSRGLSEKLFKLQRGKCACCGNPMGKGRHLDHAMPLALGGANEDWNIQLLCPSCNHKKQAKHPIEFMQSRGFLL